MNVVVSTPLIKQMPIKLKRPSKQKQFIIFLTRKKVVLLCGIKLIIRKVTGKLK